MGEAFPDVSKVESGLTAILSGRVDAPGGESGRSRGEQRFEANPAPRAFERIQRRQ